MDNSTRNLHSLTHSKLQTSNIPIPSSSVTLGYTPSAMAAQPQNSTAFAPTNQASFTAVLPSSSSTAAHPPFQAPSQQYHHSQHSVPLNGVPMQQSSTAPAPADNQPHQPSGSGGPLATAPFLRDFSLVAEAAKRAQMSVVLRDLESVTL